MTFRSLPTSECTPYAVAVEAGDGWLTVVIEILPGFRIVDGTGSAGA
jgi:hypothetical protein